MSKRISWLAISGLVMTAALAEGMAGTANAAVQTSKIQAATSGTVERSGQSTRTWEFPRRTIYHNDPWPFLGRCDGESYAIYDSNTNKVNVVSRGTNTSALAGCRLQVRMNLHLSFHGYAFEHSVVQPITTACSTIDFSCPSDPPAGKPGRGTGWDRYVHALHPSMSLTNIDGYTVERR